jgi:outer membrane immunogenic protein
MNLRAGQSIRGEMRMSKLFRAAILPTICFGWLALSASGTSAQTFDRMELGANYNYLRTNAPPNACGCFSLNGGGGWFAYNFTDSLALVGEVGSARASNIDGTAAGLTLTSFLGGPRYSLPLNYRIVPFAQLLLGGAHASGALTPGASGAAGSANSFAMTAGGGVDVKLASHVALRAFQIDYYLTRFDNGANNRQNNFRISAGIVFRFGRQR